MGLFELIEALRPVTVKMRGGEVRLSPLPARWASLARSAFPSPRPPKAVNPSVGSAHPDRMQDDYGDPKYRIAFSEWHDSVRAAEVALADLKAAEPEAKPPEVAWVVARAAELRDAFTPEEIGYLHGELVKAGTPELVRGDAPSGGVEGELFGGLVRELRAEDIVDGPRSEGFELPEAGFVWEEMGLLMEAAALYSQPPETWILGLTPAWKRICVNHVRLRMALARRE